MTPCFEEGKRLWRRDGAEQETPEIESRSSPFPRLCRSQKQYFTPFEGLESLAITRPPRVLCSLRRSPCRYVPKPWPDVRGSRARRW